MENIAAQQRALESKEDMLMRAKAFVERQKQSAVDVETQVSIHNHSYQ